MTEGNIPGKRRGYISVTMLLTDCQSVTFNFEKYIKNLMSKENTQVLKQRREKADALAALGVNLYSNSFTPANRIKELPPKG